MSRICRKSQFFILFFFKNTDATMNINKADGSLYSNTFPKQRGHRGQQLWTIISSVYHTVMAQYSPLPYI